MTWIGLRKRAERRPIQPHRSVLGVAIGTIAGLVLLASSSAHSHPPPEIVSTSANWSAADSANATKIRERAHSIQVIVWEDSWGITRWRLGRGEPDPTSGGRVIGELTIPIAREIGEREWKARHRLLAFRDGGAISVLLCSGEARPIAGATVDLYEVIPLTDAGTDPIHPRGSRTSDVRGRASFVLSSPADDISSSAAPWRNQWLLISHVGGEIDVAMLPVAIPEARSAILWTDRPAYAPGEAVHFQMLWLHGLPHAMTPAANEPIRIQVHSEPTDRRVGRHAFASWDTTLTTDRFGTASGALVLPPALLEGDCVLRATSVDANKRMHTSTTAKIRPFAPAEFELVVRPKQAEAMAGDTLEVEVIAHTLQGLPVAGFVSCAVNQVEMSRHFRLIGSAIAQGWYGPERGEIEINRFGERWSIAVLDAQLDFEGKTTLRIPTPVPESRGGHHLTGLILDVRVDDGAGTQRTAQLEVPLFSGNAWCSLARAQNGFGSSPAASGRMVPVVRIDNTHRPAPGTVFFRWMANGKNLPFHPEREFLVAESQLETMSNAVALVPAPAGGADNLYVWADRNARSEIPIYLGESSIQPQAPAPPESAPDGDARWIALDRLQYSPGDTARAILSPALRKTPGLLWLADDMLRQPLQALPAGSDSMVSFRVAARHIPGELLIWSPIGIVMDDAALAPPRSVSTASGEWLIGPDQKPLDPGELMHHMIVEPSSRLFEVEVTTDRPMYAPGDSIAVHVRTRDFDGRPVAAAVTVQAVDEAVYAIQPDLTDLCRHFYRLVVPSHGMVGCGVWTPPLPLSPIRAAARPTALWIPSVRTPAATGRAVLRAKLPDDGARWRITARAVDHRGRLAEARFHFLTARPVTVRPALPRFARAGDRFDLAVWVDNTTRRPLECDLSWNLAGDSLADVTPDQAHVRAETGRSARADFTLAPRRTGRVPLVLDALSGSWHERVRSEFNVLDPASEAASPRLEPIDITLSYLLGNIRERMFDPEARTYSAWDESNLRAHLALADGYSLLAQQGRWDGLVPEPSPPDNSCGNPAFWAAENLTRQSTFSSYSVSNAARFAVDWEAGANRGWPIGAPSDRGRILEWLQSNSSHAGGDQDVRVEMVHALASAGLDPGLALEQAWTARDSLSPGSCALLALCLGAARPNDAAAMIEKAVATALVDADRTIASYDPWSIRHAQSRSEGTQAAAHVLEALTILDPLHPLREAFANGLALQTVADKWREWEPTGDVLRALVDYTRAGGAGTDCVARGSEDDSTGAGNDRIASISSNVLRLSRSVTVHPVAHTGPLPAAGTVKASGGHLRCAVGDTLVIELSVRAELYLENAAAIDPMAAGCSTLPPTPNRFYESEIWHEAAVELVLPMLRPGMNEFVHRLVAERPGVFQVPPARTFLTHFPDLTAYSDPMALTILPR